MPAPLITNKIMQIHLGSWRLWLDEKLFVLLISRHDLEFFDEGMAQLWLVRKGPTRPLESRWQGARKLLHRTMLTVGLLWLITAGFLLIHLLI